MLVSSCFQEYPQLETNGHLFYSFYILVSLFSVKSMLPRVLVYDFYVNAQLSFGRSIKCIILEAIYKHYTWDIFIY